MYRPRSLLVASACLPLLATLAPGCDLNAQDDCERNPKLGCGPFAPAEGGSGGSGAQGATAGDGGTTSGGGSGGDPGCQGHDECTSPTAAQCDGGDCVPCTQSSHCDGVAGLPVCDGGTCVQCMLGEQGACTGQQSCDLLAKQCVDVAPGSVQNCYACTNDVQCESGHRCIGMEYPSSVAHGYYCLKETPGCDRPFQVVLFDKPSISAAAAANYCGIEQDNATCEAVNALLQGWVCESGQTDGMCGPPSMPEQAVPGALCRTVGGGANQCTYACAGAVQCPNIAPQNTCGDGDTTPPGWCGG